MKIAIIDYSIGNLFSVFQACKTVGLKPFFASDPSGLKSADGVILPGVGAFAAGMSSLRSVGLNEEVLSFIASGKPFMGICLGMQLLLEGSEEFGASNGLGVFAGRVRPFRPVVAPELPVPKTTWSKIKATKLGWLDSPLRTVPDGAHMYFVHSYYCDPDNHSCVLATSMYGDFSYSAVLRRDNVFATQFHPEKSGEQGLRVYEAWARST
jgi:glutamine amidotransferase